MKFLVTYGTRIEVIEAEDETWARLLWLERHRPEWLDGRPGFALAPDSELIVREATPADLAALDQINAETDKYVTKRKAWR